jgi:sulfide:quinone oxidoreductase
MKLQKLNDYIYIAGQINTDDINALKDLGIKSIINNRPDNEENNQPLSKNISQSAASNGIAYHYLPITSGKYPVDKINKFTDLLNSTKQPMLVFCRTGHRAVHLWALSQLEKYGQQYVLAKAKAMGFDISLG